MKKILTVLMVLGLASVANAAIDISGDSGTMIYEADTGIGHCDVVFSQDAEYRDGSGGELFIDFTNTGTVSNLVITDLTPVPVLVMDPPLGEIGWNWGLNSLEEYAGQVHVSKIASLNTSEDLKGVGTPGLDSNMQMGDDAFIAAFGWPNPVDYEGTFGFSFDFEGVVTVGYNLAELNEWDGQSLNGEEFTVPEPMTMTLLGLGGLALLRRRR